MGRPSFWVVFSVAFSAVFLPDVWQMWTKTKGRRQYIDVRRVQEVQDHTEWYRLETSKLSSKLREKFVQSEEDEATRTYLEGCVQTTDRLPLQLFYRGAQFLLSFFMTKTSINGLLDKTGMFVFSDQQFNTLLDISDTWRAENLLDLGAGNGDVTARMTSHFQTTYVTELSQPMIWRLQARGFSVLPADGWYNGSLQYDVISCLNLLDRCDTPLTVLEHVGKVLAPEEGRLVVAMVLPIKQSVETGSKGRGYRPKELIPLQGQSFEEQASELVTEIFEPAGFELVKLTKLPYLSEGNMKRAFYTLPDAVFVFRKTTV